MTTSSLIAGTLLVALLPSDNPTLTQSGQDTIDAFLEESADSGKVPGLVALVISDDKVLYSGAFGKQNVAEDIDMQEDSIFRIASMTKPITSVAVMQLVEQGKINLDDSISKYLVDLAKPKVFERFDASGELITRSAEEITIRQLLNHTSGFAYDFCNPTLQRMQQKTGKQPRDLPLVHDPGKQWTYGMSTLVLGELVEEVSGRKLDEYLEAEILKPLDMFDTGFALPKEHLLRLVSEHRREDGKLGEVSNPAETSITVRGDYGLYSTARDYGRFLQMLLCNGRLGNVRILKVESVKTMATNQIGDLVVELQPALAPNTAQPFPIGAGRDKFGLGFQITVAKDEDHPRSVGSLSWGGIRNTHFWVDPQRGIAAVLLMQVLPYYDKDCIAVLRGFEQRVYASLE